jgi:hypothetical protein
MVFQWSQVFRSVFPSEDFDIEKLACKFLLPGAQLVDFMENPKEKPAIGVPPKIIYNCSIHGS